ncbi:hypothetical protein U9M48_023506 [Paspalum notatum var. saurae]|uniref:Uncharacterized protein n=1 Tax=Paspalum notatum var. saurae TaxID=547442 RepID=A0AAQ3WW69_PASNO
MARSADPILGRPTMARLSLTQPARSADQAGRSPDPMTGSADPWFRLPSHPSELLATSLIQFTKKHMCTQIQPQDQASNVSKGRKYTKSRIHNVNNLSEEKNGQCRDDTWSPDLLQGRPTYPRRHFTRATIVLTANRHGDARSSRWNAKAVDRVVARPQGRSADLPPRSADHRLRPPTDLSLLQVGRPGGQLARPMTGSADPWFRPPSHPSEPLATSLIQFTKKHKCTQIQLQDQASNVSKGQKCSKSRIHNVNNPREEQNGQCWADMWSPDLLQGRPTYPRKHFPHATTVLTANRHGDTRSSRWSAKTVDRVVARPQGRWADLPPRSADHRLRPPTDLSLLQA